MVGVQYENGGQPARSFEEGRHFKTGTNPSPSLHGNVLLTGFVCLYPLEITYQEQLNEKFEVQSEYARSQTIPF